MHISPISERDEHPAAAELKAATDLAKRLTRLAYAGAVAAVVALATYVTQFHGPLSEKAESWGQFGDYIGGVLNPTFSFLALIALLATFGLQVKELRISARELKNSADALTKQNETLRRQTFEVTFFQLLALHNEIVNAARLPAQNLTGRACFKFYLDELEGRIINMAGASSLTHATKNATLFAVVYDDFYNDFESSLGHYFRLLYNIIKFVDAADLPHRKFYTNLVRAQVSSAELKLIFYNCLTQWGKDKFKPLVERYALLKTIPGDRIPSFELFQQYDKQAFGGQYPFIWTTRVEA
jgi:Putative phage abortive infection protein